MLRIKAKRGDNITARFRRLKRGFPAARKEVLAALIIAWFEVVESTVWFATRPSARSMTRAKFLGTAKGTRSIRIGWEDLRGRHSSAMRRLDLRQPVMDRLAAPIVGTFFPREKR